VIVFDLCRREMFGHFLFASFETLGGIVLPDKSSKPAADYL
jgi:hypothetical protein